MSRFCIHCGAALQEDMAFCTQCGKPVGASPPAASVAVDAPTQVMSPVAASTPSAPAYVTPSIPAPAPTPAPKKTNTVALIAGVAALVVALGIGLFFGARALGLFDTDTASDNAAAISSSSASVQEVSSSTTESSLNQIENSTQAEVDTSTSSAASENPVAEETKTTMVRVPNLLGFSEADAREKVGEAGLEVGSISYENNDAIIKGNIISQDPASGTEAEKGTAVAIVVSEGKAQHRYELVLGSHTWSDARSAAESRGGYLACVTSADEWNQVLGVLPADGVSVVWVGAQADALHNFSWVSGEPFEYSNWSSGEPNNDGGTEDKLCLLRANGVWGWYDVPNDVSSYYAADKMGFIVEYED